MILNHINLLNFSIKENSHWSVKEMEVIETHSFVEWAFNILEEIIATCKSFIFSWKKPTSTVIWANVTLGTLEYGEESWRSLTNEEFASE